jgi:hypothetical protein
MATPSYDQTPSHRPRHTVWPFVALILVFAIGALLLIHPRSLTTVHEDGVEAFKEGFATLAFNVSTWWGIFYHQVEVSLGNRQAMIQFGAVGVFLGLLIIWYRRP